MKKMKKILALVLTAVMLFSFAACGNSETPDTPDEVGSTAADEQGTASGGESYVIGICQLVQHEALDAATQGFKDYLTERLGDRVSFNEQNASGEPTNCTTIVSQFVSTNEDLIMANASGALSAAAAATEDIPILGTSITDYATALQMENWTGTTGMNISGTSDLAPLAEQAAMIQELCPDAQEVGILYCSAEPNSKYQADVVAEELTKLGLTSTVYTFVDTNDVQLVTQNAVDNSDVIYIPTDNTAASNTTAINNIAEPAGVPIIAGEEGICKGCGVATLSISYYDLGRRTGEMAYDILVNGADPATMEIAYASDLTKKAVMERAEALNITVPEDYEAIVLDSEE